MDVVFLDANVLFSAAYRADAGVRRLWELPETRLITSAYASEEARRNLKATQRADLEELLEKTELVPDVTLGEMPSLVESVRLRLPDKDVPILLAAIRAKATHLITGDFKHFGPLYGEVIEGMRIMPPADYLLSHNPENR